MTQIIHSPFGQHHPYEQLPEERYPRQPLAGEVFTVGMVTRPPGAVKAVRLRVCVEGSDPVTVDAARIDQWQPTLEDGVGAEFLERRIVIDQDVWQAQLIAPAQGQRMTYTLEADGVIGETFEIVGEAWEKKLSATEYHLTPQPPLHDERGGKTSVGTRFIASAKATDEASLVPTEITTAAEVISVEWLTDGTRARRARITFKCARDERFFGLGERFNALNQRGNVMDIRCYEQYKNQGKRTYMPVPFLLSSAGWGVYVESSRWMQFDLTGDDRWVLEADLGESEQLPMTWFVGDDPAEIIGQFTQLTGGAVLPPLWAFGLWMSGNEWNSQQRVMEEAEATRQHDIPASVLVIEAWSDEATFYIWNDAQYTPVDGGKTLRYGDFSFPAEGKWPDPKGMVDALHEQGIKVLLWQVPALKLTDGPHPQQDADRAYFEGQGFGVREADGSAHKIRPFWFRGGYIWDMTHAAEREWWLNKRAYLLDEVGIDGFKTDGGEHLWGLDVRFHDGRRGDEVWNEYPKLYTQAYYDFATARREALTFSRAGFAGSQRSPAHWAGDENSTWDAFRHSIFAGLSAGVSGIPFWGWDFGGFSGEIPSAELYLRGAAMAAFCPIMQYHAEFNQHRTPRRDRTPWNIAERTEDERVIPTMRYLVNVRHNLMPYIWQEAQHSAASGEPMMRALGLYAADASPYAYFFGRDLLVFPVVEEGATEWRVTLPPGVWHDLWTGEVYKGAVTVPVPLDRIPVFVRDGAEIPVRLGESGALGEAVPLTGEANGVLKFKKI